MRAPFARDPPNLLGERKNDNFKKEIAKKKQQKDQQLS